MFAKKNVVAAAALTLVAAAAQAQVTLYGTLDASVGRKEAVGVDANGNLTKNGQGRVDSNDLTQSYIGFKGQEDLGGGLRAFFKLENALNLDTGASAASNFWSRNAYVGLGGDFGAVKLGRAENLFKLEGEAFSPFGESQAYSPLFRPNVISAQVNTLLAGTGFTLPNLGLDASSWANSITYTTPNLSGFKLSVQSSLAENQKSAVGAYAGGGNAVSARYDAGPLGLSVVYGDVRNPESAPGVTTGPDTRGRDWLLGASYDFGVLKLYGQYGQDKLTSVDTTGAETKGKTKRFQVGAGIPVTTDGSILVAYGESKFRPDDTSFEVKARDLSLGYQQSLSKRTAVYGAVGAERLNLNNFFITGEDKVTTTNFSVGVKHSF